MKTPIHHLLGETRTAILAALLLRPEQSRHVRDLVRTTGLSPGALHRELTALVGHGILDASLSDARCFTGWIRPVRSCRN